MSLMDPETISHVQMYVSQLSKPRLLDAEDSPRHTILAECARDVLLLPAKATDHRVRSKSDLKGKKKNAESDIEI
jgi:hypothetical protein